MFMPKRSDSIKVTKVQNVYLNGSKVTTFDVYFLDVDKWVFGYSDKIYGWYKDVSIVLDKILNNGH